MALPLLRAREVRWRPETGEGLEHLTLAPEANGGVRAEAVVIGARGGRPYGLRYRIACDAGWRVTSFEATATDGRGLAMRSPSPGTWLWADGSAATDFAGCLDIDLSGTPFTNTLPIRRAELDQREIGRAESFRMLYVPFDTFVPIADGQLYTRLGERRFLYQAQDRSFEAELAVDDDGLVLDYPHLFRRAPLS